MRTLAAILCVSACVIVCASAPAAEPVLAVIVHRDRRTTMSAQEIETIYLKKRRFWDDGDPIVPLNREAGSAERETFSRRVLGGASAAFVGYWNDRYFDGIFPPTTLLSSAAVKRYVAADRNAIGYVWSTEIDDSVRVLLRLK
jgi:ABC-type phosphate transport system substrate-binding protein